MSATDATIIKTPEDHAQIEDARVYEIGYHLIPTLSEDARAEAVDALRKEVEGRGASIVNETYPELIELAYPMAREIQGKRQWFTTAYFGWMFVEMGHADVAELQEFLRRTESLLRFIVLVTTKEHALAASSYSFKKEVRTPRQEEIIERVSETPTPELLKESMSEEEVDKAIEDLVGEEAK